MRHRASGKVRRSPSSRGRPDVGLNRLAERGNSRRASDAEVLARAVGGVEPHQPEQSVFVNAGKYVGNLGRLAGNIRRACLGDEYRIAGQLAYRSDGRPEYRNELPGRLEVVGVDSYPVHIRPA